MTDNLRNTQPKLLIVDDNLNERQALTIGLKLEGFDTAGATSGAEALELMQSTSFDAVLIELMMPQMHGLQLVREIQKIQPGMPTILMSAYHLTPMQLARADSGVVGFIPKPYQFDELLEFLEVKLQIKGRPSHSKPPEPESKGFLPPFEVPSSFVSLCLCKAMKSDSENPPLPIAFTNLPE